MIQIRKGTFETNSSSTHSICISKEPVKNLPSEIHFRLGDYGWDNDTVEDTASYLYTGIQDLGIDEQEIYMTRLDNILKKYNITPFYEGPKDPHDFFTGVDHAYELIPILNVMLKDEDLLLRFLFSSASCVYTGNDNQDEEDHPDCVRAEPTISSYDPVTKQWTEIPNPNHDPEKFDYFLKGN